MWLTFHPPSLSTRQVRRFVGSALMISTRDHLGDPWRWISLGPWPWELVPGVCCERLSEEAREKNSQGKEAHQADVLHILDSRGLFLYGIFYPSAKFFFIQTPDPERTTHTSVFDSDVAID